MAAGVFQTAAGSLVAVVTWIFPSSDKLSSLRELACSFSEVSARVEDTRTRSKGTKRRTGNNLILGRRVELPMCGESSHVLRNPACAVICWPARQLSTGSIFQVREEALPHLFFAAKSPPLRWFPPAAPQNRTGR